MATQLIRRFIVNADLDTDPLSRAVARLEQATNSQPVDDSGGPAKQVAGAVDLSGLAEPSVILTFCVLASVLLLALVATGKVSWTALFFRGGETQRELARAVPLGGPMPTSFNPEEFPTVKRGKEQPPVDDDIEEEQPLDQPTWQGIIDLSMFSDTSVETQDDQV